MPMMRRGPLDRYTPEWVLRQANAHGAEGSIEFHTDQPVTVYLQGGRVYAAEVGVDLTEADLAARPPTPEHTARDHLIQLLAGVMSTQTGWYFHDPLGRHPSHGAWSWETATLLMDIRSQTHEARSLALWNDRMVALRSGTSGGVTLSADTWAVVVALAGSARAGELRTHLGWSPDRTAAALAALEDQGLLAPDPMPSTRRPPPPAPPAVPGPPAPVPGPHHPPQPPAVSPNAPPAAVAALRRRVLPGKRTRP